MKVDKQKFDSLLDRLIKSDPQKRSETKPDKKLKTYTVPIALAKASAKAAVAKKKAKAARKA